MKRGWRELLKSHKAALDVFRTAEELRLYAATAYTVHESGQDISSQPSTEQIHPYQSLYFAYLYRLWLHAAGQPETSFGLLVENAKMQSWTVGSVQIQVSSVPSPAPPFRLH